MPPSFDGAPSGSSAPADGGELPGPAWRALGGGAISALRLPLALRPRGVEDWRRACAPRRLSGCVLELLIAGSACGRVSLCLLGGVSVRAWRGRVAGGIAEGCRGVRGFGPGVSVWGCQVVGGRARREMLVWCRRGAGSWKVGLVLKLGALRLPGGWGCAGPAEEPQRQRCLRWGLAAQRGSTVGSV